jgi:hypothetical protein
VGECLQARNSDAHFYTKEKNLFPFGVRVLRGMLLIPVYSPARELVGLQLIGSDDNGNAYKRFFNRHTDNGKLLHHRENSWQRIVSDRRRMGDDGKRSCGDRLAMRGWHFLQAIFYL